MAKRGSGRMGVSLDDQLCYAIYGAAIAIGRLYKPILDELGLTYPQFLVLSALWEKNRQTVGGIAERLGLEPSTITPLLKRMETAGLVTRSRSEADERQVIVALRGRGDGLRKQAPCLGAALVGASGKTPRELATLNLAVREIRDAAARSARAPGGARVAAIKATA